jgi:predicted transcriptional regulator
MKKNKRFTLKDYTDIKIFLLFLLDNIRYPVDYTTISKVLMENIETVTLDFGQCLTELTDNGHLLADFVDGESYYMISDTGKEIAAELYDNIDEEFRESAIKCAAKYVKLTEAGVEIASKIEKTEDNRYKVTLSAKGKEKGEFFNLSLIVSSYSQAEEISENFELRPDGFYRGVLFCATGRFEFLS